MVVSRSSRGGFTWVCDGDFDLGSQCIQRSLVDAFNLLFAVAFSLFFLVDCFRKNHSNGSRGKDMVFTVVSVCCIFTSIAYLSVGLHAAAEGKERFSTFYWVGSLFRGLVWMLLAASLHVLKNKWERILVLIWWVTFSTLICALNVEALARADRIQIIDAASWPVNLMLFFCAYRLSRNLNPRTTAANILSQPLLEEEQQSKPSSPKLGFLNGFAFTWINPLLRTGYSKALALGDIPALESKDEAQFAYEAFAREWDLQRKQRLSAANLVLRALLKCYIKDMIWIGMLAFLRTLAVASAPLFLYAFIHYSASEERDLCGGILLVALLMFIKVVESLSQRHWFFGARRFGMRMRSALMVAVYRKLLKLSSSGRRIHSTGEIVNYIAVDAYRLGEAPWWFHTTWNLPLQLALSIALLIGTVGAGAIPGLVPLIICGFLNVPLAKIWKNCQTHVMEAQDQRLRATSEVLNSIKIIKLQSWEEKFQSLIDSLRESEFRWLKELQIKKSYGTVLYWMSPMLVSAVVLAGCAVFRSTPLNASNVFTVLATLRVMSEPVRMLPEALTMMIQVKVSLDRLNVFLLDEEIREEDVKRIPYLKTNLAVRVERGEFSWNPHSTLPTLKGIDLEVSRGQKISICGPVGAGKSSLLHALLGEIPKISGSVEISGSIAYVSQSAWIQSGTVRDNILYGKPMDQKRYEKAIKVCALAKDIDNFSHGDLTEIGQRGLNLSGGQKQRLQLARAVYNDADIYLLDDPFSAVDAHTGATLFNECVMAALENKTVILVTHQVEFLAESDSILVMEGGQIIQSGSYAELLKAGSAFEQLVAAHHKALTSFDNGETAQMGGDENSSRDQILQLSRQSSEGEISAKGTATGQLTEDEEKEIGDVGWKPYIDYIIVSKGSLLFASVVCLQMLFVLLQSASFYWLAFAVQIPHIGSAALVGVYAGISTFSCLFVYLRTLFAAYLGLKASKEFFTGLMNSVFKAPMLFFDSTPVGRILTRASSDLSVVDFDIPYSIAFALTGVIEVVMTIIIMATVTWQVVIVAVPIILGARYVQAYYLASANELIRINGTTKAPVMNYAAETSLGVVTIRAFAGMERFIQNYLKLIDTDATLFFHTNAAMEWVLLRVESLQNLTVFTAALLLVLLPPGSVAPGLVGLSLSYALTLSAAQLFLTRYYCSLANFIVSVERINQYMHIPAEPPAIVEDKRPPSSWPFAGRIDLIDLKIKYRPNAPVVLKGITCTFQAGHRVGVVGRTGSGKTTLISALFRLVEPAYGRILIDDLDICSIGLKDLRMSLSIIPQEPVLFRGNVRTNLDPLGHYSDQEIWEALEKCQLAETIRGTPNLLDLSVSDEGENWSVGQRQLFCLGRVLLKRNRILVLDEATASIDSATDVVLQKVIREEFANCTVITVAHRVPTVTDSDMVMVLSFGKLIEYDKPSKLMETNSSFSNLVAEYWANCGKNSTQNLNEIQ